MNILRSDVTFTYLIIFSNFPVICYRPKSETAKKMKVSPEGLRAAQETVNANYEKLGKLSFWEGVY